MIYCIWYPTGGFGHYLNAVLSMFCENFKRPKKSIQFNKDGNLHKIDLIAPKWLQNPKNYNWKPLDNLNYSVLIDNDIHNDENTRFKSYFNNPKIIRITYDMNSWPIIAMTSRVKPHGNDFMSTEFDINRWNTTEDWAIRESYFLYLKLHHHQHLWKDFSDTISLPLETLLDYNKLISFLTKHDILYNNFSDFHSNMLDINNDYLFSYRAKKIIDNIGMENRSLSDFETIWSQSILYYFIWLKYNIDVPHNDFKNFFKDTNEIVSWLKTVDKI